MDKGFMKKCMLVAGVLVMVWIFFIFDLDRYFSLASLKGELDNLKAFYAENKGLTMGIYMVVYILVTALSLPGATVMTLAGGAVFGLASGLVLVSFASTFGATLAFLFSRYMFRDWVQVKFSTRIKAINKGIEEEGGFYLFTLRLVPMFPFFVINMVMGLTPISTLTFYLVSQVGMLPGTLVYVNAGTQLGKIDSLAGILSPGLVFSFVLLGVFPLIAKKIIQYTRVKKIYASHERPEQFDYNLVVIGAGSAGLVSSYIAAAVRAKVALIEEGKMGGDCLNTGCVPSKTLIASTRLLAMAGRSVEFGIKKMDAEFEFKEIMARIRSKIQEIEPHDSVERYSRLGVDCIKGRARVLSPFRVGVGDRVLTTRNIIVATGAKPLIPQIKGLDQVDYLTSDTIWDLEALPKRLVVLGGGPIGCELAQAFARLGSKVFMVQRGDRIMKKEDPDASALVMEEFEAGGIQVCLNHVAKEVLVRAGQNILVCDSQGQENHIAFDRILVALGRVPNTKGFGLEELGVKFGPGRGIKANGFLQTNFPNIFCSGDVHGQYQFTHTAAHESWYAAVNALFGKFKKFRVDYGVIPWATYTDPEVARVGLNEQEACAKGIAHEVTKYEMSDLDRAITDSQTCGFVKVLTVPGKDKILGATIVGSHGADMIAEFVLAMKHGIGLNKLLGTIHIYPTMSEANKYAAGMWKKAHAPEKLLAWVERFHCWMRNSN